MIISDILRVTSLASARALAHGVVKPEGPHMAPRAIERELTRFYDEIGSELTIALGKETAADIIRECAEIIGGSIIAFEIASRRLREQQ